MAALALEGDRLGHDLVADDAVEFFVRKSLLDQGFGAANAFVLVHIGKLHIYLLMNY